MPTHFYTSLSCIYASLQHFFIRWTDQDHIPPDDEQFNGGISSGVEQFYVDDGWVFINPSTFVLSWVITNPLSLITTTIVSLLSWVCPLLFVLYHLSPLPHAQIKGGGVEMMVIFTCGYLTLWLSTLIIVLLGYGLIANLVNIILYYSRWLRLT
jgi:predicted metal-binding membrane protein